VSEPPVVNASPVIYLARASLIDLLQVEGSSICVPRLVSDEIRRRGSDDPAAHVLETTPWLQEVELASTSPKVLAWRLGSGETAVLSWSLAHPGSVAIVDDLAARRCAEVLGLPFTGTLGVVLRAKRKGILPAARPAIDKLLAAGMYLSSRVLERALALVGE